MSTDELQMSGRREAVAAWLTLTAPGALVTCAVMTVALIAVPQLTPWVSVGAGVRRVAAVLLLIHAAVTLAIVLKPGHWPLALLFLGLLALDALLGGLLIGAQPHAAAALIAVAVLVISLEVGGWLAASLSVVATGVGAAAAVWWEIGSGLLLQAAVSFPTMLAVETSFAGRAALAAPAAAVPTVLTVETLVAGVPAVDSPAMPLGTVLSVETRYADAPAFASAEEVFVAALAIALVALCLGLGTSVWRVRRARSAVAASIVAAARVAP
jgi:hypothetical protein